MLPRTAQPMMLIVVLFAAVTLAGDARIIHVDTDATDPTHDGSSWCTAYTELHEALATAQSGDEVRVAEGTYKPADTGPDPRENSFVVPSGVRLLGGYAGCSQPNPNARNIDAFTTTLSGDRLGDDGPDFTNREDNHFHVIESIAPTTLNLIEGFHVTAGHAVTEIPNDQNRHGAGLFTTDGHLFLRDVDFVGNRSRSGGSAIYADDTNLTLESVHIQSGHGIAIWVDSAYEFIFSRSSVMDNHGTGLYIQSNLQMSNSVVANSFGRGIYVDSGYNSQPNFIRNSTIVSNHVDGFGTAGVDLGHTLIDISNSIIWANTSFLENTLDMQLRWIEPPTVNFSSVMGWDDALGGFGNIDEDPELHEIATVQSHASYLSLKPWSPCINAGSPTQVQPDFFDADGNVRVLCGRSDMGAYEYGPGDVNCDGIVSIEDYAQFSDCTVAPGKGCESVDFALDGDVDLHDFGRFQLEFDEPPALTATYRLIFDATWSIFTHSQNFPPNPHFSPLIGAVHNANYTMWEDGGIATSGIESMAETGGTFALRQEILEQIDEGNAESIVQGAGVPNSPGEIEISFTATLEYPLISLTTMIAPSPDWFVGVDRFALLRSNHWIDREIVFLQPYDAGSDGGIDYTSPNAPIIPFLPISKLTGFPVAQDGVVPPLGTFTIERID